MKKFKLLLLFIFLIPLTLCGCERGEVSVLATPQEVSVNKGLISFVRVSGAEYYTINFNNYSVNVPDKTFTNTSNTTQVEKNGKHYLECNFNNVFSVGQSYVITIKACAQDKRASEASSPVNYTHKQQLKQPTNLKFSNNTVSWDNVDNANQYEVRVVYPNENLGTDNSTNFIITNNSLNLLEEGLLNKAGNYYVYVRALVSDNSYFESEFSECSFSNQLTLSAPIVSDVHGVSEFNSALTELEVNYHIYVLVDENTNSITISANGYSLSTPTNSNANFLTRQNNLLDVNLTKLFNQAVDLNGATITVQASNTASNFYKSSPLSSKVTVPNVKQAATLTLLQEGNQLKISSTKPITELTLFIANNNKIEQEDIVISAKTEFYYPLPANYIMACAYVPNQILKLSNFVVNSKYSEEIANFEITQQANNFSFEDAEGESFLVETDSSIFVTQEKNFSLPSLNNVSFVRVTAIANNKLPKTSTLNTIAATKLQTPSILAGQGIKNRTISFQPVEHALGYKIVLTRAGVQTEIDHIFANTTINLAQYLDGQSYTVSVIAVADKYLNYANSDALILGEIS